MRKIVIPILLSLLLGITWSAQAQSAYQVRCAKATAMDVYDNYVDLFNGMNHRDAYTKDKFDLLFTDSCKIGNDIRPFTEKAVLSPADYYRIFSNNVMRVDNEYQNLRINYPKQYGDIFVINFSFEKQVVYTDKKRKTYPSQLFQYEFTVVMDTVIRNDRCQNVRIKEVRVTTIPFGEGRDRLLSINAQYGIYNNSNQIFNDNKVNDYHNIVLNNTLVTLGIDYSMQLTSIKKTKLFLNVGAAANIGRSTFMGDYTKQLEEVDEDGDAYTRNIKIDLNSERISTFDIALPISVSCWVPLMESAKKSMYLSFEGGGYVSYLASLSNKVDMDASYTGTYHYFFGDIVFDHYYDYSVGHITETDFGLPKDINKIGYGLEGGLGLVYSFGSNMFKLDVSYRYGLSTIMNYKKDDMILSYDNSQYESILQKSKTGISSIMVGVSYIKKLNK